MRFFRLSVFTFLLASILTGAPLLAQAVSGDRVITTDRLNLRTCPETSGCQVLRTLPLDTLLNVVDRQGEWLQVIVLEDEASGWVHSGYTREVERSASLSLLNRDGLLKFLVIMCVLGALLVPAVLGPKIKPEVTGLQFFGLSALSVVLGAVILLNQFGPALANLASPYLNLGKASFLWEINALTESRIGYSHVVLFLAAVVVGVAAVAPTANGCRISFLQGVGTGFSALPIIAIALCLAGALLYVVLLIFKVLGFVAGILSIPVVWIWNHVLAPVLRFLAIPLVWLWENVLQGILQFLAIPFVWIWQVILEPVLGFLYKFVLAPLGALVLGTLASILALFPLGVVGLVFLESLRSATRGPQTPVGLFSQGVAIGFLLFDAALLAGLNAFALLQTAPPLSLLLPLAIQVFVFLRLLGSGSAADEAACPLFEAKLQSYWSSSRLDVIATCVLAPIGLFALFHGEDG